MVVVRDISFKQHLAGIGGEAGRLIAAFDWTSTSLGPIATWPGSLRTMLSFLLRSPVPMVMLWGADGVMLYNDAYSVFAGGRHPGLLGSKVREGWPEVADFNDNVMKVGLAGGTLAYRDQELTLFRDGVPEQVFMNLDYSSVPDDDGTPAGVLAIVVETTKRVASERQRDAAETSLRASEERFRALIEASSDIIYRMSPDWTEMRVLHGRGSIANTGPSVHWLEQYVFPEDQAEVMAATRHAIATRTTFQLEHRVQRSDGSVGWMISRAIPVLEADGRVSEWFGMAADVTDRRRDEETLREREEQLRLIVENARDYAIFTTRLDGRIDTWLPGATRVFGWTAQEAVGRDVSLIFTSDDRAGGVPRMELDIARREGAASDVRWHIRKDGARVFIDGRMTALRDAGGNIKGFLKIGQDVTARRSAEEVNARLAAIVTSTSDAIIAFAAEDGRILSWNKGAEDLFGYTEAEAVGGPVGLLVPPDLPEGDPTGVFRRAIEGSRVHEYETVRVAKSGERIPVSVTASRMLATDGRVLGVAGIFRDMRQRKAADERQALLAREVDHRAKNALAVVQSMVLLTPEQDPATFKRAIAGRVAALARAQTLLAQDRWTGADLRTLLLGDLMPFLGDRRAELDGPPVVLPPGAAQPMAMAIHELATNAVKHGALSMPTGSLRIDWRLRQGEGGVPVLQLRWSEAGGPVLDGPPNRRGFGSRVLEGTLRDQLQGNVTLAWRPSGLVCEIAVPLKAESSFGGELSPVPDIIHAGSR